MSRVKSKQQKLISTLSVVCICLIMIFGAAFSINAKSAYALTDVSSAYQIGVKGDGSQLTEIYDDTEDKFNANLLHELFAKTTGNSSATLDSVKSYIKANGLDDYNTYGINSPSSLATTPYYVIPASVINANAGNEDNGIVVSLGGYDWIVTSLTLNNLGEVVATLYMADEVGKSVWYKKETSKGNNMYSRSTIRNHLITHTNWSQFSSGSFATKYLIQPKNIEYQQTETISNRQSDLKNCPNDALGILSSGWEDTVNYSPDDTFSGFRYDDWGNDYIWLPSVTEIGPYDDALSIPISIWRLSSQQRSHSGFANFWLRSGMPTRYHGSLCVDSSNNMRFEYGDANWGVRPAIHLNLESAYANSVLAEPTDASIPYTGDPMTLSSLNTIPSWYNAAVFDITYDNGMRDAGEYTCTATIKPALAANGVTFDGTPDTSIGENATVRKFKFTIEKKKIGATLALGSDGMPTATLISGEIYSGDIGTLGEPQFGFNYSGRDGTSYSSDVIPTSVGKYKAVPKVINDCNYEIDTSLNLSIDFDINKKDVAKPSINGVGSYVYDGSDKTFTLSNVTSDVKITAKRDTSTPTSQTDGGITVNSDGTLTAKRAGKYVITVMLADNGTSTQWAGGTDTAPYDIPVEITKKPLTVSVTHGNNWSWNVGADDADKTVKVVGDCVTGDRTELYMYALKSGTTNEIDLNTYREWDPNDNRKRTIVMPELPQGTYTFNVRLFGDHYNNDNYEMTPISMTFTIAGKKVNFTTSDAKWKVNGAAVTASPLKLTYTGSAFNVLFDTTDLASKGVMIDSTKAGTQSGYTGDTSKTNVGTYSVTVYLKELSGDYESWSGSYTLNYEIEKAKYDLSGLRWNYSSPLTFNNRNQSVTLTGTIPTGLTVNYTDNEKKLVNTYTASVSFTNSNSNYITPISSDANSYIGSFDWTLSWEIAKAKLKAQWKRSTTSGSTFTLPKLLPDGNISLHDMVEYTWYDEGGNEIAESDVKYDGYNETKYKVKATLQSVYASSYELEFNAGEDPFEFTVGVNMYPIKIEIRIDGELLKATYPYRGSAYIAVPKVTLSTETILPSDITVKYKRADSTAADDGTTTAPSAVGKYKVLISVKSDTSYIDGDCDEFEFEIVKADFDTSAFKWEYRHGNTVATYDFTQNKWIDASNAEVNIVYDGEKHSITLLNANGVMGLTVSTDGTEYTDAGAHTATVTYTYDSSCYNAPSFPTSVKFDIAKGDIDVSNVRWGYTKSGDATEYAYTESFTYTRVSGVEIEYNVKLIGVPNELKGAISYVVDSTYLRAASKVNTYKTKFVFDATKFDTTNYNIPEIFDNTSKDNVSKAVLPDTLDWEIEKRYITTPVYDESFKTFDDKAHSIIDICGLGNDWEEYVEITVTKDGKPYDGYNGNVYDIYDSAEYVISFKLKILDATPNIAWTSRTEDIKIFVGEYKLRVESWKGEGMDAETEPNISRLPRFFEYVFTTPDGEIVTVNDILSTYNTAFLKTLKVKDIYKNNVKLEGETSFRFVSDPNPDSPPTAVEKPYFGNGKIMYDGNFHTISDFELKGFETEYMQMTLELERVKDIGIYKVTVEFVRGANYSWITEDGSIDKSVITLEYEITVRRVAKPTSGSTLEYNGEIQRYIPEGLDKDWVNLDGNEAKDRGIYTVTAELADIGNTTWEDGTTDSVTFTFEIVMKLIDRPKAPEEEITYNGKDVDILGIMGIDILLFDITGDTLKKDAGEYTFTLTLKDSDNYGWKTSGQEVSLVDSESVEITWNIEKAKLKPIWNDSGVIPSFNIPSEYVGLVEIEYEYTDNDGNTVKKEDLVSGESYKVVAKLKEGYEKNFVFTDSEGEVLGTPTVSEEKPFDINNGTKPTEPNNEPTAPSSVDIPKWLIPAVIVALCFIIATFLLVIGLFVGMMILIAMKKNETNTPYSPYPPYPPYYMSSAEEEDDDDDDDDEDDEDEEEDEEEITPLQKDSTVNYAEEIAAAADENGKYVPEGAVVIDESQLVNRDEAKRLDDEGSYYAFEKRDGESVMTVADGAIVINGSERLDIKDSILLLSDDQKRYFFGLRDYAMEKSGGKPSFAKYHLTVGKAAKQVIRLGIKDGEVIAYFRIEDERLRNIRRNAKENDAEIKIKETEIQIDGESAYEMAKDLIDLRQAQIEENLAYRKQLLKEKRKAKRDAKKNEGNNAAEGDEQEY